MTTTPFGQRAMTPALIASMDAANDRPALPHIDKWEVLRNLTTARLAFGVTDRDLAVLSALISFHPDKVLGDNAPLIVFPSNASLSDRTHGMAESTLRRHLAALVAAGLILRHDSPNGKRYAAKGPDGAIQRAFGFDLRPLLVRGAEIAQAARATEEAQERTKALREAITLKKRDALKLAAYGASEGLPGDWDAHLAALMGIHRVSRRKLSADALETVLADVEKILDTVVQSLNKTKKMDANDIHSGRHHQNSNTNLSDLEPCLDSNGCAVDGTHPEDQADGLTDRSQDLPNIPLGLVTKACPDIVPYADSDITGWHHLVAACHVVRPMMGISPSAWADACRAMGPETAAVTVAAILQRFDQINSPGGYLRALTRKAADGRFSPGPMVMALLTGDGGKS